MDTPAIADFPDEHDRLREWQRRRAGEDEQRRVEAALAKAPKDRTGADWTLISYSPFRSAAGCGY